MIGDNWYNGRAVNGFVVGDGYSPLGQRFDASDPEFFIEEGHIMWRSMGMALEYLDIYSLAAPYSSIVMEKAKAYAGGKIEVLNSNTDNYVRGEFKEWEKLFNRPNEQQTGRQFFDQLYQYRKINGWTVVKKVYPFGFNDRPSKLYNIPFWWITLDPIVKPVYFGYNNEEIIKRMWVNYPNGTRERLNPKEVILITDDVVWVDDLTGLPKSSLSLLQMPITALLSSCEAEITMMQKRGAIGLLSNQTADANGYIAMKDKEKKHLRNEFQRSYGLSRAQSPIIISDANLQWQSMTFPTKDLMLHESAYKAIKDICEALGYPYELTAFSERKNLANVESFGKQYYQDYVMPESQSIDEQLMMGMNTKDPIKLCHYYEDLPVFQQSNKDMGDGRKALNEAYKIEWDNGTCTRNDWRVANGEDEINQPAFTKYKWELTPEELGIVNQNINNGTQNQQSGQSGTGSQ